MISNTDFEKLWFMYQTDGCPKGISINAFCLQNGIPYNEFEKWYRKTHRAVERIEITGMPEIEETKSEHDTQVQSTSACQASPSNGGIQLTIKTSDGLVIQKNGLDYTGMKLLVERLEGLC